MTLINFKNQINAINFIYTANLSLQVQKKEVNALNSKQSS